MWTLIRGDRLSEKGFVETLDSITYGVLSQGNCCRALEASDVQARLTASHLQRCSTILGNLVRPECQCVDSPNFGVPLRFRTACGSRSPQWESAGLGGAPRTYALWVPLVL